MSKTEKEQRIQKTSELHGKIFDLLIESKVSPTEAASTVAHVLINLGVGELDMKSDPSLFHKLPDNKPCFSVYSACKRIQLNIVVGDDLSSEMMYNQDSKAVKDPTHETNKLLN